MASNPFKDRDLTTTLLFPTLSWSSFNAFVSYDKEKWYDQYVLGIRGKSNPAMDAGRVIGEKLAIDPTYLPQVPRPEIYELELEGLIGEVPIMGHLDGWTKGELILDEFKTTTNVNKWTQEAVDDWGQITMYCLLLWLNYKIHPKYIRIRLTAIFLKETGGFQLKPTGEVKTFETRRSMKDLLSFGAKLKATHKEMISFVASKKDLRYNVKVTN